MSNEALKKQAALAAMDYVPEDCVVGVGTGSTVKYFIEALANSKHLIEAAVASSIQTANLLREHGIPVIDLPSAPRIPVYVDGADEVNQYGQCIKGGGGALTREKIIAASADKFVCIVDESKVVDVLGKHFPVPLEVLDLARSYVGREMVKLGGDPEYREGFTTDNGHIILDIHHLPLTHAKEMEEKLNHISGIVCNGLFVQRSADVVLVGTNEGCKKLK